MYFAVGIGDLLAIQKTEIEGLLGMRNDFNPSRGRHETLTMESWKDSQKSFAT
jgi:hypothetical protein